MRGWGGASLQCQSESAKVRERLRPRLIRPLRLPLCDIVNQLHLSKLISIPHASLFRIMNSLRAATQGIRSLSLSLARDRAYSDNTGDIQANHCAGVSLLGLETGERSQSALPSAPKDSLFVSEDESDNNDDGQTAEVDASYIDGASEDDEDGEDIEWTTDLVAWVNSLAVPAVSAGRCPLLLLLTSTPERSAPPTRRQHPNALSRIDQRGERPSEPSLGSDRKSWEKSSSNAADRRSTWSG